MVRSRRSFLLVVICLLAGTLLTATPAAAEDEPTYQGGALLGKVLEVLRRNLRDAGERLDAIEEGFTSKAAAAADVDEERRVVHEALSQLPMSHLSLMSASAAKFYQAQLAGQSARGYGFELIDLKGQYFVSLVVAGSPAAKAGLLRGDEVLRIGGRAVRTSGRLDLRTDDCHLPDAPTHLVTPSAEPLRLRVRRTKAAEPIDLVMRPAEVGYHAGDRARVRVIEHKQVAVGYVPITFMYVPAGRFVAESLAGPLAKAQGIVLDARGRGGSILALQEMIRLLRAEEPLRGRPIVLLTDGRTRSAKEVLAEAFTRHGIGPVVGERTAGAVRPGRFLPLVHDTYMVCPFGKLKSTFSALELVGHPADIEVADRLAYAAGADPILEAGLDEAARRARAAATTQAEGDDN